VQTPLAATCNKCATASKALLIGAYVPS
jgi:hypothetical protein